MTQPWGSVVAVAVIPLAGALHWWLLDRVRNRLLNVHPAVWRRISSQWRPLKPLPSQAFALRREDRALGDAELSRRVVTYRRSVATLMIVAVSCVIAVWLRL